MSSRVDINVLVVIDTDYVKTHFGKGSQDPNNPKGIDHNSQYMIANDSRGIVHGQGTADLILKANVGDAIHFRGTSIYQNSDDAVIVYGIKWWSRDHVFNTFVTDQVTRNRAVQPDPDQLDGIPPLQVKQNFLSLDSTIRQSGTENFYVYFALYTLADDGQTQELYGYYYWDPQIQVPS